MSSVYQLRIAIKIDDYEHDVVCWETAEPQREGREKGIYWSLQRNAQAIKGRLYTRPHEIW
jgi:hypothetical protein